MRLFFTECDRYLYDHEKALSIEEINEVTQTSKKCVTVHFPVDIDTEYQTWSSQYKELLGSKNLGSLTLTAQIKALSQPEGKLFCHWDMRHFPQYPQHFPLLNKKSSHVVEDYLRSMGIDCELKRVSDKAGQTFLKLIRRKRVFKIVLFAHFAVADFLRVCNGQLRTDLQNMMIKPVKGSQITQKRHLKTEYTPYKQTISKELIRPDWYMTIGGQDYALEITVHDSSALHGIASLSNLAKNTGTELAFKDNFTSEQKEDMLHQYQNSYKSYVDYAMGDLAVSEIMKNNANKFHLIWEALAVNQYFKTPVKTIGSTVSSIFGGKIASLFEGVYNETLSDKELDLILDTYTRPASSEFLIENETTTRGLLAKVLGGRCFNNRPLNTVSKGVLCDIDISGCYGEGLRGQLYPMGKPTIIEYPKLSKTNGYLTLREFLNLYKKELVAGLWQLWFSVSDDRTNALNPKPLTLVSSQDYFSSYTPPKKWSEIESDEDHQDSQNWLELPDHTKIYSHQIVNSVMTHDGLQWLENICSRPLRNQILDNSIVICAEFYPASQRVDSVEELHALTLQHTALNTSELVQNEVLEIQNIDRECRKWFAVELGVLMVNTLLIERKKHPKKDPLNTLFKLCTNTLYGVMVSKYFKCSNSLVGQNVTARARSMSWCLEKGLHGQQSITDGAVFDLNRVAYAKPRQKLNDTNCTSTNRFTERELQQKQVIYRPLNGFTRINWLEDDRLLVHAANGSNVYSVSEFRKLVDVLALQHLQNQFAGLDILHKPTTDIYGNSRNSIFVFESKGIVKSGVFHGSANYFLAGGQHDSYSDSQELIAFRSYKKQLSASPVNFCKGLLEDVTAIERQDPFIKQSIVKVDDF